MMKRIFPAPLLSAALFVLWLLLNHSMSKGHIVLGAILGLCIPVLTRAGIRHFWATHERGTPELRISEGLPIAALMALCMVLTVKADSVMQYTQNAANTLHAPGTYIQAVMETRPVPNPTIAPSSTPPSSGQEAQT